MKIGYKLIMISALLFASCGGSSDDSPTVTTTSTVADPQATSLIFPENNTECNEGTIIDETTSRVTFLWNASEDTDTYQLSIRNMSTNETATTTVSSTETVAVIDRGEPYEWYITSKATGTTVTADSPKFKFYNQGPGVENYAPFPAEAINPTRGGAVSNSSGTVTLEWKGTDIDDDITSYEVFFGTDASATSSLGSTSDITFDVAVSVGTIYYWSVICTDSAGNTSQSDVFEFNVSS